MGQLKDMYLMPFRAIAAAMRMFVRNRNRVRDFARQPRVANTLKYGMMITLLLWLAIALFNRDDDDRLAKALKDLWPATTTDAANSKAASENH